MTYTAAALLGVLGAGLVDLFVLRTRLLLRPVFWATYPIVVFFQLISNGILTGRDIVRYAPDAIIGWRLAYAPVEDLLFGFALVLLTLSVWVRLGRAGVQRTPAAGEGSRLLRLLDRRRSGIGRQPSGTGRGDSGGAQRREEDRDRDRHLR
ncbi:lycopene cyclase domain-containing protein [Micromonospora sp. WMMD1102]|uniref:lycopene cyclase domain-containing protein n=1 Tax=Micromonospora sp. WMMD1102 TaxID=3016105 RepID=UPI0024155A5B|nr:lycopene cyclase domain-containing protein [Micromonospora sp. WMMD1102]MDG4788816.1 lycopene cyclase domain-containing protein [Micromonospora sp. WMMD1102]